MIITLHCPCGASTTYSGNDIYGQAHFRDWRGDHRDCEPVALPEARTLYAERTRRIAGWRR